ncbi:ThuA domain-containing protein [Robiginitalea aurantiaca]|uniref:ThuA domain-containing protein n=1 Tax=Robiginitalea aurantiaca TaxID=3056915 RepID=A0ABT7WAM8_9FLAO|nr:ThuA domain-containing protein [Robiginitalea aurantiaca]MDM9629974.1 ThuA domain-containing protein [Robiginitalea aurantiaca]
MIASLRPVTSFLLLLLCSAVFPAMSLAQQPEGTASASKPEVLVYTNTNGFRHTSIEFGLATLGRLAEQEGVLMDHTEDSLQFNSKNLSKYQLVVFLSTTGDVLAAEQEKAFRSFVEGGGAFMGIHAATDTEYDWPWYGALVGAYFESHPDQQEAVLNVEDRTHPATAHMPKTWKHHDEWYNFKNINPDLHVLIRLDEASYEGGKNGVNHPIAWYHENAGGRVFYTGMGHTEATFKNPLFIEHLRGGLRYCLGMD